MVDQSSVFLMLRRIWSHLSPRRHVQFGLLLLLIIFSSFMEMFSIGAVLPFLGVMTAPEHVFKHTQAQWFIKYLHIETPQELLFPITFSFVVLVLLSALVRLILVWANARLTYATSADLSIAIYRHSLYQSYPVHILRTSSEVIAGITSKSDLLIHSALSPATTILSSIVMTVIALFTFVFFQPYLSLIGFYCFAAVYIGIIFFVRRRLYIDSQLISRESIQIIKALQEGLGGIRDVLLDGAQEYFCKIYQSAILPLRYAQGKSLFIASSPRYLIEAVGIVLVAALTYTLSQKSEGLLLAIPMLGALAIAAQRLLPVLQQAYTAWVSLQGQKASIQDALNFLDQPLPDWVNLPKLSPISWKNDMRLCDIFFRYSESESWVLREINLIIRKGSRVGFMGATGSGKSTLLDLIMGLLQPSQGQILIDRSPITSVNLRAWQATIAHVPQEIFLADCSVEENIAFGVSKNRIDFDRVRKAAMGAQIFHVIEALPQKYKTLVGERGVRLSGGQRQRIGIARALYKQASLIIFDEATSALDSETESAILSTIDQLGPDVTVIMIAHRLSTLSRCDSVIELADGSILRQGCYKTMVE